MEIRVKAVGVGFTAPGDFAKERVEQRWRSKPLRGPSTASLAMGPQETSLRMTKFVGGGESKSRDNGNSKSRSLRDDNTKQN
jgi:hypothetical protein